ncbi:hypothetical protein FMM05_20605 [Flavobacterium zepuense]|uniref:Uncharacterized protein n=1 Tax=Flavobacterium zepuense TaxID=2593302 RepID=A0A552US87_9FLAO|nr:hypothetical protein [Flavobacterium zepuense]TRW21092.1 hypothetical protein FMM05_20605 [Flavobacterium zepuense]
MKRLITVMLFCATFFAAAQSDYRQVVLKRKGELHTKVPAVDNKVADKALQISSYLFSRKEFQDSVARLSFPYYNHCKDCGHGKNKEEVIQGKIILDSIFRRPVTALELYIEPVGRKKPRLRSDPENNKCFGLGNTCPDSYITSYYENINCDMAHELPFSCAYAVHISHEYLHFVGYCHKTKDVNTDIAEAVGWIAYYFIKKWYDGKDAGLMQILAEV